MASTGVLPFLRGIDLSRYDFSGDQFPASAAEMSGLRWLKINRANLERVPDELSSMSQIEQLQMTRNELSSVHGELSDMPCLRSVIVRHNKIKTAGIPSDVFAMRDLNTIDFSHNSLKDVPPNLERAKCAIVLNLSHNSIEQMPSQVFTNLIGLVHLDVSHNKLSSIPPQLRRVTSLQTLNVSHNPLHHVQLKQLPSLSELTVLHMANTARTDENMPTALECLANLKDVDFSQNSLQHVPDALFKLKQLRKINLSDNQIAEIKNYTMETVYWEQVEVLNMCRNALSVLPDALTRMTRLKMLLLNDNQLQFEGIPPGIGKLVRLEVLHLAHNRLQLVPEGLSRCVKLRKLRLNHNQLVSVPDGIHLLSDLGELDVRENAELIMPPKPREKKRNMAWYNIDFSLENQLKLAGQSPTSSVSSSPCIMSSNVKDHVARKKEFLQRRKAEHAEDDTRKILQGMNNVVKERNRAEQAWLEEKSRQPKRWDQELESQQKTDVDYGVLFDSSVGTEAGLTVWEIENFLPNLLEEAFHGHFYEGDCYVVLHSVHEQQHNDTLTHHIYFWIGDKCSLDKKACAAIHAVNLRNNLSATCRTIREEMNDESDEFIEIFGGELIYVEGERSSSGFFTVEEVKHSLRIFRIMQKGSSSLQLHAEPVPPHIDSLDPRFVFLLDAGSTIYVWCGRKCKGVLRSKTRLLAEKMNKFERKGNCEIEQIAQGEETEEFWLMLTGDSQKPTANPIVEHVPDDFMPPTPKLFELKLGMGYLELPQTELRGLPLTQKMLSTKGVYMVDCLSDVFLWVGKASTRLMRAAGTKLVKEIYHMVQRPGHATLNKLSEGTETMFSKWYFEVFGGVTGGGMFQREVFFVAFKTKFAGWDDVIAVDFTRTADSVQKRGPDLKVIMEKDKMKTDLSALFLDRQQSMNEEEAEQLLVECNEDLELMEPFVLEGKKFVRLPDDEFGIFYSSDCYVFLCRYWVPPDEDEAEPAANSTDGGEDAAAATDDFQCVVYFWQGRDAGNMGWLNFTFSLQKKFEALFKDKLEVVRMYQQQENHKFLSHFKKRFVVHRGRRHLNFGQGMPLGGFAELFQVRANGSCICTRSIQVDCKAQSLMSAFCFVFRAPYRYTDDDDTVGRTYVWLGSKSAPSEQAVAEDVARALLARDKMPVELVKEGEEPEAFWRIMPGGQQDYETDDNFLGFCRLFRCTNERGYFAVSEKTVDFCQDDLQDDDIMILDNGVQVYIWLGGRASEVELKLAYKAVQVYMQHVKAKQPEHPRKLLCTLKGKEPQRFRKCFHAWGKHKVPAGS